MSLVNETVVVVRLPTTIVLPIVSSALVILPRPALAWDVPIDEPVPQAEHRSGFTAGLSPSFYVGRARGYPNEVDKIDNSDFLADSRIAPGGGATLWLGGALRDWFTFGIGFSSFAINGNDLQGGGFAALIRTEAFPLVSLGGLWEDLGIFGDFGGGSFGLLDDTEALAGDGGSMGMVGVGLVHESIRFGHFAFGPSLEYHSAFSATMKLHVMSLGIRAAFYGGP